MGKTVKKIIYRLERRKGLESTTHFYYDVTRPMNEQISKFMLHRYIDDNMPEPDTPTLHYYYDDAVSYGKIYLNIPLNFANKNHIYIDYLYYSRAINDLNSITKDDVFFDYEYYKERYIANNEIGMINKRYLINYVGLGLKSLFHLDNYKNKESKKSYIELMFSFIIKKFNQ